MQKWKIKRGGIEVQTSYSLKSKNLLSQMAEEYLQLKVNDSGKNYLLEEKAKTKIIYPQEFLELLKMNNRFEFLGWFERNEIKHLKRADNNNIVLLRKK